MAPSGAGRKRHAAGGPARPGALLTRRADLPLVWNRDGEQASMRLKSAIWVAAYLRRRHIDGTLAVVRRRGAEEAGAIFIKISRLDGTAELYGPAPQTAFEESRPADRARQSG